MRNNEKNIHKMGAILQAKKAPEGEVKGAYENSGFSSGRCATETTKCEEKKGLTESDVLRALYHMYCAAAYKGNVTMSSETAIGLYNFFNSQKAEIEHFNKERSYLLRKVKERNDEIERLEKVYDLSNRACQELRKRIESIKAEAIKEYLVKLNDKSFCLRHIDEMADGMVATKVVDMNTIIKVAKEMMGDVE